MRKQLFIGAAIFVSWLLGACLAAYADDNSQEAKPAHCQEADTPLFNQIPYFSRVFKTIGVHDTSHVKGECQARTKCAHSREEKEDCPSTIGVDFQVWAAEAKECPETKDVEWEMIIAPKQWTARTAAKAWACQEATKSCCDHLIVKVDKAKQGGKKAGQCACQKKTGACACHKKSDKCRCGDQTAHIAAKAAVLAAVLKTRDAFDDERQHLIDELIAAKEHNARLEAQVELAEYKQQMAQELMETMAENFRLKAQLELASQRQHAVQTMSQLTAQNIELKSHLAKLEQQLHVLSQKHAATAAAARSEKRRR